MKLSTDYFPPAWLQRPCHFFFVRPPDLPASNGTFNLPLLAGCSEQRTSGEAHQTDPANLDRRSTDPPASRNEAA